MVNRWQWSAYMVCRTYSVGGNGDNVNDDLLLDQDQDDGESIEE